MSTPRWTGSMANPTTTFVIKHTSFFFTIRGLIRHTQKADSQPKLLINSGAVTKATMLPTCPAEYAKPKDLDLLLTGTQLCT